MRYIEDAHCSHPSLSSHLHLVEYTCAVSRYDTTLAAPLKELDLTARAMGKESLCRASLSRTQDPARHMRYIADAYCSHASDHMHMTCVFEGR